MAIWEDLENESGSDKDEVEDEANVALGLVSTVASDAEFGTHSEDENEVYSKLTRAQLIDYVKEVFSLCQTRSKQMKELRDRYVNLLKLHEKTCLEMENIEDQNRYFKQMTNKWSNKALSEKDIALQQFIMNGIDRIKVASMIYSIYKNSGRGIGLTEGKPNVNSKSCFECIREGFETFFVLEAIEFEVVIQSELESSNSKTLDI